MSLGGCLGQVGRMTLTVAALWSACSGTAEGQQSVSVSLVWDSVSVAAGGDALGIPLSAAADAEGNLLVANMAGHVVVKFDREGSQLWTSGGQGDGPGEYQLLYRVAVAPDGRVFALDFNRHDLTELSLEGEFLRRVRLPFRFTQIDALAVLDDGSICITGITRWTDDPMKQSVHVFDADLRHLRSFGPVPVASEDWILQRWGAGAASVTKGGEILFTRRLPYEVYRFTAGGSLRSKTPEILTTDLGPDDAYVRTRDGARTTYATSGKDVLRPHAAFETAEGWLLVGRSRGSERHIDLIDPDGRLESSIPMPPEWRSISAIDADRSWLWVKGERRLEPIYFRVKYEVRTMTKEEL